MKKTYTLTTKAISMFLALLLIFYIIPISAVADAIKLAEQSETATSSTSPTTSVEIPDEALTYLNEAYEASELREESVKHFRLEDGSYVAALYATPVHYLDEDGKWQDINNTLTESGSELATSDARVKFAKKTTGNGSIFTLHNGNTKVTLSLVGANKKVEGVVTNTEETETTAIGKLMSLEGLSSSIRYNEILSGVDIEYVLDSLNIKENIIIKEKSDSYSYTFTLALNSLEASLLENGDVAITKNGETQYTIPAPVVFDSADNTAPSTASGYELTDNGGGEYTLTVTVSSEWMNSSDRVYPVTLDPAIVTGSWMTMVDAGGSLGTTMNSGSYGFNVGEGVAILKLKQMPPLCLGAKISSASMTLKRMSGEGAYIGLYYVNNDWTENIDSIDTTNVTIGSIIDYCDTTANDDGTYGINDWFSWNLTEAVKYWYSNPSANYGMVLSRISGTGETRFTSSNSIVEANNPVFTISYVNTLGVEDYYSYSSQGGGAMGTGYVNYATGDLTFSIGTLTGTDYLMPVTPSLVYNSSLANKSYTSTNVTTPYTSSVAPYGFKLNLIETLVRKYYMSYLGVVYYYVWSDADGTEHCFYPTDEPTVFKDDSGLLLTLTVPTSGSPTITDIDKNVRTFARYGTSTTEWVLSSVADKIGNKIQFNYDSSLQVIAIKLIPNGSGEITSLVLSYSDGKLYLIANETSKEAVFFKYSDTYNGAISTTAKNYLRQVIYAHGTDDNPSWTAFYNSGSATDVVADATMYYEYDENGYLISAKNGLADYTINYEWTDDKVTSIYEKGGTTEGVRIGFTYGTSYTEVTTPGGNGRYDNYSNSDNIITRYTYDEYFRVISSYSTDVNRSIIYGATTGKYETQENIKNNIAESTVIGGSPANYVINGGFAMASLGAPPPYWETSHSTITVYHVGESPSVRIPYSSGTYYIYQNLYLPAGSYTFAFDISSLYTDNLIVEAGVFAPNGSAVDKSYVNVNELEESNGYYTYSSTFKNTTARVLKLKISVSSDGTAPEDAKVYIKNIMLEKSLGATVQYNRLIQGGFEDSYRDTNEADPSNVSQTTFWTASNGTSFVTDTDTAFNTVAKIEGDISSERYLHQTGTTYLIEDPAANVGLRYIVSGFAKAPSGAFSNQIAKFALRADVYYLQWDSAEHYVVSHYFDFSTDTTDWQFVTGIVDTVYTPVPGSAEAEYSFNLVEKIEVYCEFSHQNGGTAYFDNISFYTEGLDTNHYSYNEVGLPTVVENYYSAEYREYNDDNTLNLVANNEGELYIYDYYDNGLIKSETYYNFIAFNSSKIFPYYHYVTETVNGETVTRRDPFDAITTLTPITQTVYEYDAYGLTTKIETYPAVMSGNNVVKKQGSASIVTENTYITTSGSPIFGALETTSDGTGTEIKYFYDTNKGYLLAEVNTGAKNGTTYTYDAIGNLISVTPATYNSTAGTYSTSSYYGSVSYEYNAKNELSKITTSSSIYTFTYDKFGRMTNFMDDDVVYGYMPDGKINYVTFGANSETYFCAYDYEYDSLGRLVQEYYQEGWYDEEYGEWCYDGILVYEYEYTADGKLYCVYDYWTGKCTLYDYDHLGRLQQIVFCSDEDATYGGTPDRPYNDFSIYYDYDNNVHDRISSTYYNFSYLVGTTLASTRVHNFNSYNGDGTISSIRVTSGNTRINLNYTYDDFKRPSGITISGNSGNYGYSNQITYGYNTENGVTTGEVVTYTSKVGNVTSTYTYTYDDRGNITSVSKDNYLLYKYYYDDLGQLIWEDNYETICYYQYSYDNAGNLLSKIEWTMPDGELICEYSYSYASSPYGDRLVSYSGETITYDEQGRTISYRGKTIAYNGYSVHNISQFGNAYFTYHTDGMRSSKTVNGVTHYYYYDGINLIKEEWGDNVMVFLYDASGSVIGMQYRNSTYDSGEWNTYYYEKNLQGDIVSVYDATGTKLVSYSYDAWGRITDTNYSNSGANTSVVNNPLRYRGYYYDDDLDLYYLATRYYDPETCRFVTADSYVSTGQGILGYNRYAYCGNNPVMRRDPTGEFWIELLCVVVIIAELVVATIGVHNELSISNQENNVALDNVQSTTTKNRLIDDQNCESISQFQYGLYSCDYNGCEAIALHNAKLMKGMESSLSSTIDDLNNSWGMIGVSGVFGSNPYQIGRVLDIYEMDYTMVNTDEMNNPGVYIVSYRNSGSLSIHTIAVRYDGYSYVGFNPTNYLSPSTWGSRYICGYYLGE